MRICLEELRRCQILSPRPNFIVLLGKRYGWRPLPADIEAKESDELFSHVPDADKALLTTEGPVRAWRDGDQVARVGWYRKDLNAVPPMYVLQQRTIAFPQDASDDDRKRIRREESRDWAVLERRMREAFLAAIAALGWPADDPRRFKYEASATHQEIRAGALEAEDPHDDTVRVWDSERGQCLEVLQGFADVTAIALGAAEFPVRALVRRPQTVIEYGDTGNLLVQFPVRLHRVTTHPSGRTWAGPNGNRLYIITLEGGDRP